jgi:DNA-binding beta-propeller fold protein YncE
MQDGGIIAVDIGNARIRLIKDGEVRTIAGSGETGRTDGTPMEATFHYPMDLVLGNEKTVYIADAGTHLIRSLIIGKEVTTLALGSELHTPHGIAVAGDGTIYVADMNAHQIVSIDKKGNVSRLCGTGKHGTLEHELNRPAAVLVHAGHLWIADLDNHQVKVLSLSD